MIRQPNAWTCYPTAAAICTGLPLQTILDELTHDGSKIIKPGEEEPNSREAFNSAELSLALLRLGYSLVIVNARLEKSTNYPSFDEICETMLVHNCIITIKRPNNSLHALAWDGERIWDPMTGAAVSWEDVANVVYIEAIIKHG